MTRTNGWVWAVLLSWLCMAGVARAENATKPGAISTPYPTVINLAVEWAIEGDDNLNGVVDVRYRRVDEPADTWHAAMPLRRVPAGKSRKTTPIWSWSNKHSGSIFDLKPGTEYEIKLALKDSDGGSAEKTVRAKTRPVPRIPAGAVIHDLPAGEHGRLDPVSGTAQKPSVYRSKDGKAIFEHVNLQGKKWVFLEGLTLKGKGKKYESVGVKMNGAENCVIRRCKIDAVYGIIAYTPGATNCYIADNTITGTTPWTNEAMGAKGKNVGEGIEVTGPGNVICFNKVSGFRDALSYQEDANIVNQVCIDMYNNDVYLGTDDGIEADFAMGNCRIVRNRLTNCFVGLSSQPSLGGPTYFIRNVMYNLTYAPFKLHRFSQGDVVLHNTTVKVGDGMVCFTDQPFDHALFRNNLSIGGPSAEKWGGFGAGNGRAVSIRAHGPHCSFDYDAVGTTAQIDRATIGEKDFKDVEPHGLFVDMSVFNDVPFPIKPVPEHKPVDLRPKEGAAVVDAGQPLANINDGFAGKAPDIGAYEAGQPLPHYGPRPAGEDEATAWKE